MPETAATPEEAEFNALIATGQSLLDLAVMPDEDVEVYDNGTGNGMYPVWAIANDALEDEDSERTAINLVVETGDRGEADWIAWLINNGPDLLERLKQGRIFAKTLRNSLTTYNDIALEATGLHDLIQPDGDGDWQCVWESVADLGNRCRSFEQGLRKAQRRVAELESQLRGIDCANGHHSWTEQGRGPCVCGEPAQPLVQPTAEAVTDRG